MVTDEWNEAQEEEKRERDKKERVDAWLVINARIFKAETDG